MDLHPNNFGLHVADAETFSIFCSPYIDETSLDSISGNRSCLDVRLNGWTSQISNQYCKLIIEWSSLPFAMVFARSESDSVGVR